MKNWQLVVILVAPLLVTSCNQKTLSLLFDIPPATKEKSVSKPVPPTPPAENQTAPTHQAAIIKRVPPEIEKAKTWEEAKEKLPVDQFGQPDWVEAFRQSIIEPRNGIGDEDAPAFVFGYDFYLPGSPAVFDAFFPHSAHTQVLDCANCHPKLFPYRGTKITMADINEGKYCGVCHGKVAFSAGPTNCGRCHPALGGGR